MVYADQKNDYLTALMAADAGNRETFARFVFDRVLDAISYASELLEDRLRTLMIAEKYGDPPDDDDAYNEEDEPVADRLQWIITREVSDAIARHTVFDRHMVSLTRGRLDHPREPWEGYSDPTVFSTDVTIRTRAQRFGARALGEEQIRCFEIWEPDDKSDGFEFIVRVFDVGSGPGEQFDVRLSDIDPEERASFTERFRSWIRRQAR
jgi:hypothetical protein